MFIHRLPHLVLLMAACFDLRAADDVFERILAPPRVPASAKAKPPSRTQRRTLLVATLISTRFRRKTTHRAH